MKRCLILVEGQTEERFVKDVLAPAFEPRGVFLLPTILTTKVVKNGSNLKGGVTSYAKLRVDLCKLLTDSDSVITTMIDYYGLPSDTPGMADRPPGTLIFRVRNVENAIHENVGSPGHFKPFLALHEFEALLFTDHEITATVIPAREKAAELLAAAGGQEPEDINENRETTPSKRLLRVFPLSGKLCTVRLPQNESGWMRFAPAARISMTGFRGSSSLLTVDSELCYQFRESVLCCTPPVRAAPGANSTTNSLR